MRPPLRFVVGDKVIWTSVNHKGAKHMTVEKVGRRLVYVVGDRRPYRISDGAKNDGYAHECIRSVAVAAWDEGVRDARDYFAKHGLRSDHYGDSEGWLVWAADVLRSVAPADGGGAE